MPNYSDEELERLFQSVGTNVRVSRHAVLFNAGNIALGSNVRIDSFCVLSAGQEGITVGDYVHIGAAAHLFGSGGAITLEDFCNISSRVSLFTANDDYTGGTMTNPMVDEAYKTVKKGSVHLHRHAIIGCGSIILPDVVIGVGGSIGALSLVNRSVAPFEVVAGTPIRTIGERKKTLLDLEREFLKK